MSSILSHRPIHRNTRSTTLLGTVFVLFTAITFSDQITGAEEGPEIANPASQFCIQSGGELSIRTDNDGGQYGVCVFDDNRQCEEWAMLRGRCPLGGRKLTGYLTDEARYCVITGGRYVQAETTTNQTREQQDFCELAGGITCDALEYFGGDCSPPMEDFTDPFAFCTEVMAHEIVSAEATEGHFSSSLAKAMIEQGVISADVPEAIRQTAQWRCMNGDVWVCVVGANLPCGEQADTSRLPSQAMLNYCRANAGAEFIPTVVTGRATIYEWGCIREDPSIIKQAFSADSQGFLTEIWHKLNPPGVL